MSEGAGASGLVVRTPEGETLLRPGAGEIGLPLHALLRKRGVTLNTRCAGRGSCAGCTVELERGELVGLDGARAEAPATVKACRHRLVEGVAVELRAPRRSMASYEAVALDEFSGQLPHAWDPVFAPGPGGGLAAAVDIGTTTVAVLLVDLRSGEVVGRSSGINQQLTLGDDVLTRISLCRFEAGMRERLTGLVLDQTLGPLIGQACASCGRDAGEVAGAVVAGNTTMLHLLAGEDPSPLGVVPFEPVFLARREMALAVGGREISAHLLPGSSAYVGADIVAGVLACGLRYGAAPAMLVDVGTNGELVLFTGEELIGCATAAGPAFEGTGMASGARAGAGVVAYLDVPDEPGAIGMEVIGGGEPHGLCGSAYVDFLAQGFRAGILNGVGRLDAERAGRYGLEVTRGGEMGLAGVTLGPGGAGEPLRVTEGDIATLLQAKAAIAAGIETLLTTAGLTAADLRRVVLAGGFGTRMRVASAIGCGLLPGIGASTVEALGNTALAGALLSLRDRSLLEESNEIAERVRVIELNLEPGFQDAFTDHMLLG